MPVKTPTMKPADIARLVQMLRSGDNSGGHMGDGCTGRLESGSRKKIWSDLARRYFRMVAFQMGLIPLDDTHKPRDEIPEGRFKVSFNPGGPAVAGDVYLDTAHLHACLSGETWNHSNPYYRREEWVGEPDRQGRRGRRSAGNRQMRLQDLLDVDKVVAAFRAIEDDKSEFRPF